MKGEPVVLAPAARVLVDGAIREVFVHRVWELLALNVRTNHVHVVLRGCSTPETAMTTLKAWSTRRLREQSLLAEGERVWARHGSTRYLWTQAAVVASIHYVHEWQAPSSEPRPSGSG
jgi:REP element-mobilizing transposase RayT